MRLTFIDSTVLPSENYSIEGSQSNKHFFCQLVVNFLPPFVWEDCFGEPNKTDINNF